MRLSPHPCPRPLRPTSTSHTVHTPPAITGLPARASALDLIRIADPRLAPTSTAPIPTTQRCEAPRRHHRRQSYHRPPPPPDARVPRPRQARRTPQGFHAPPSSPSSAACFIPHSAASGRASPTSLLRPLLASVALPPPRPTDRPTRLGQARRHFARPSAGQEGRTQIIPRAPPSLPSLLAPTRHLRHSPAD
ncbi:hypothetical protein CDD83_282 [Cordyceps sp. RAO-2017]|nr:hypothetical protein CDD83_282 [Cordyceps sp. RAO-2017]